MKHLQQWQGVRFVSSPSLTPQFARFARTYKKALLAALGRRFTLVRWQRGHFSVSAFFRNTRTGKMLYLSCSDVRVFPTEWHDHILIRQTRDERDFTGGTNHYVVLDSLRDAALRLTAGA